MISMSLLKPFSLGRVAEDKKVSSKEAKIHPIEVLPNHSEELNADTRTRKSKGIDNLGKVYTATITEQAWLTATWMGVTNLVNAPDLMKGEQVMLYTTGDSGKFYWSSLGRDDDLRRLETFKFRISANPDIKDAVPDVSNGYEFTFSSHDSVISLTTSTANNEFTTYDMRWDLANGLFKHLDGEGNYISLDSKNTVITLFNKDESTITLDKKDINIKSVDNINMTTETWNTECTYFNVKCEEFVLDASTSIAISTDKFTLDSGSSIDISTDVFSLASGTSTSFDTGSYTLKTKDFTQTSTTVAITAPTIALNGAVTATSIAAGAFSAGAGGSSMSGITTIAGITTVAGKITFAIPLNVIGHSTVSGN